MFKQTRATIVVEMRSAPLEASIQPLTFVLVQSKLFPHRAPDERPPAQLDTDPIRDSVTQTRVAGQLIIEGRP